MAGEKRKRAYGVSCTACRQKKIACDGVRPRCAGCRDSEEECLVPTPVRSLRRLQTQRAQESANAAADVPIATLIARMSRMEERMNEMEDILGLEHESLSQPGSPSAHNHVSPAGTTSIAHRIRRESEVVASPSASSDYGGAKYRLTVDGTGNVTYHGLTSWSQGPIVATDLPVPQPPAAPNNGMTDPSFAPLFQAIAASKHISVAPKLGDALLDTYFCYQVFNIIQRSAFLRDMALGGSMFSEFLLMSMYASATRMIDGMAPEEQKTQGDLFTRLAKEYLAQEMEGPTKITTIQGLLLLSGRECALGEISQGWNHAGLAFRMIHDLGIHLSPNEVAGASNLSAEEQATRDRLFWTAFIWDKSISLALGREPTLAPRRGRDPNSMADFDDDDGPWVPYFTDPLNCSAALVHYVYQPKRRVAAFRYHSSICLILHDVIMELYSTESRLLDRQRMGFIAKKRQRLDALWNSVPDTMKFQPTQLSPPPWIFMLQLLYHATSILLYRSSINPADVATASGHVAACTEHCVTANQMAVSFTRTFGPRMTYVGVYSSFVAASFDMQLLDSENVDVQLEALNRLRIWLDIMQESAARVPSVRRSVHHISTSTFDVVSRHPVLAMSEPGQWISSLHSQHLQAPVITPTFAGMDDTHAAGLGAFDFFDLFGPTQTGYG